VRAAARALLVAGDVIEALSVKPLPSDLYVQTEGAKVLPFRRSRRRARDPEERGQRLELRLTADEREKWILAAAREGYFSLSDWIRDRLNSSTRARALLSSDNQCWNTPRALLDILKPLGPIGLDPCSNATSIVRARTKWTVEHDGLPRDWRGRGLVYVNSEYGDALPKWVEKCDGEASRGVEILSLFPARTDTQWFERARKRAIIALLRGRLKFLGARDSAPFPSAVAYWGRRRGLFRRTLDPHVNGFVEPG
jgi:hypothetical protein